jgi:hypothetical protein
LFSACLVFAARRLTEIKARRHSPDALTATYADRHIPSQALVNVWVAAQI